MLLKVFFWQKKPFNINLDFRTYRTTPKSKTLPFHKMCYKNKIQSKNHEICLKFWKSGSISFGFLVVPPERNILYPNGPYIRTSQTKKYEMFVCCTHPTLAYVEALKNYKKILYITRDYLTGPDFWFAALFFAAGNSAHVQKITKNKRHLYVETYIFTKLSEIMYLI